MNEPEGRRIGQSVASNGQCEVVRDETSRAQPQPKDAGLQMWKLRSLKSKSRDSQDSRIIRYAQKSPGLLLALVDKPSLTRPANTDSASRTHATIAKPSEREDAFQMCPPLVNSSQQTRARKCLRNIIGQVIVFEFKHFVCPTSAVLRTVKLLVSRQNDSVRKETGQVLLPY